MRPGICLPTAFSPRNTKKGSNNFQCLKSTENSAHFETKFAFLRQKITLWQSFLSCCQTLQGAVFDSTGTLDSAGGGSVFLI